MIAEEIRKAIDAAVERLDFPASLLSGWALEHPTELANGDYATNVALVLAKQTKTNPKELAEKIMAEIRQGLPLEDSKGESLAGALAKVEVAGAGFINFYLTPEFFANEIDEAIKAGNKFGKNKNLDRPDTGQAGRQKIIVEYTDPNPFKEFHIGHLMSNTVGEAISRLIEWSGAEVKRACYQGDMGLHVAKALWGMKQIGRPIKTAADLGRAYALGANKYEADEVVKKEIEEINRQVYEGGDQKIDELYVFGRRLSLDYFDEIYKKLGTQFDYFFYESDTGPFGKQVVEDHLADGVFEQSQGAIIFRGEKYGLHTRVFVNKLGLPTYEAKELGLSQVKYDIYPYDWSVVISGNEINDYFKVLLKAMELVFPVLAAKTKHFGHGMLRLPSGKMSSRTGDVITAESLITQVGERVREKINSAEKGDTLKNFEGVTLEKLIEQIAVGAIKFSILKQAIGRDIIFDLDKSISFEGDSGPYLQYTYVRTKSIIEKARELGISGQWSVVREGQNVRSSTSGTTVSAVEKLVYRLPEVIEKAAKEYAPQQIVTYLLELAAAYNGYYAANKIVDTADPASPYRVALTAAVNQALKNGLTVLGIPVPERM